MVGKLLMSQRWLALSLAVIFLLTGLSGQAQPAAVKWFPRVKTKKDQRTLQLLSAGKDGFSLIRWQESRTDQSGNRTPALPLLTILTPSGERLHDEPLPGFEQGVQLYRFATANDSVVLVAYESPNTAGTQSLFVRRFNLQSRKWSALPQAVFTNLTSQSPAFSNTWFSRTTDDHYFCIYNLVRGKTKKLDLAMFDQSLRLVWQRQVELPLSAGRVLLRQVRCTKEGGVLVHCQVFDPKSKAPGRPLESTPSVFRSDGTAAYQRSAWAAAAPPHSNAVFLIPGASGELADFYPKLGKNYTPSFEMAEGPDGRFYCAGFYGKTANEQVDGYFIYRIDPTTNTGEVVKAAGLPKSLRAAFMREKAAARREPVSGLSMRWIDWTADGRPWILAERQNFEVPPGRLETAVLLRLDTTYRIVNTRKVEKYQRFKAGDPQGFASVAACQAGEKDWWLLWNKGSWPQAQLMLSEFRSRGTPKDYSVDSSSRSNVSLLPQTLLKRGDSWYFVGESEYHERIRIGRLQPAK